MIASNIQSHYRILKKFIKLNFKTILCENLYRKLSKAEIIALNKEKKIRFCNYNDSLATIKKFNQLLLMIIVFFMEE